MKPKIKNGFCSILKLLLAFFLKAYGEDSGRKMQPLMEFAFPQIASNDFIVRLVLSVKLRQAEEWLIKELISTPSPYIKSFNKCEKSLWRDFLSEAHCSQIVTFLLLFPVILNCLLLPSYSCIRPIFILTIFSSSPVIPENDGSWEAWGCHIALTSSYVPM